MDAAWLPGGPDEKESHLQCERYGLIPGWEEFPTGEEMVTHSSLLAGENSLGQRSPGIHCPWGLKEIGHDLACTQQ